MSQAPRTRQRILRSSSSLESPTFFSYSTPDGLLFLREDIELTPTALAWGTNTRTAEGESKLWASTALLLGGFCFRRLRSL